MTTYVIGKCVSSAIGARNVWCVFPRQRSVMLLKMSITVFLFYVSNVEYCFSFFFTSVEQMSCFFRV